LGKEHSHHWEKFKTLQKYIRNPTK